MKPGPDWIMRIADEEAKGSFSTWYWRPFADYVIAREKYLATLEASPSPAEHLDQTS